MHKLLITLLCFTAPVLFTGLFRLLIERLYISVPLFCLLAGIGFGPEGAGWLRPEEIDGRVLLEEIIRVTLALALMAIALTVSPDYFRSRWRSFAVVLIYPA